MKAFFKRKELLPQGSGPILCFDMGGTKMRAAISRDGRTLAEPAVEQNEQDFERAMALAAKLSERVLEGERPRLIVVGVAGILSASRTELFSSPHLPEWSEKPLVERLRDAFACPVRVENDAAFAGLGEATYGAGRGHNIVAYLTVSTGIGGARIVEGKIDVKSVAFEPGHQIVDMRGMAQEGGGELEGLASGSAIMRRFNILPKNLIDSKILAELARVVGIGVANTVLHWSPDIVVLGGSIMTGQNSVSIREVESHVRAQLQFLPRIPAFSLARLGDFAGLHGALSYARNT